MNTHPTLLNTLNSVLVVIDMQAKLSAVMAEKDAELMHENTVSLLEAAKKFSDSRFGNGTISKWIGFNRKNRAGRITRHSASF